MKGLLEKHTDTNERRSPDGKQTNCCTRNRPITTDWADVANIDPDRIMRRLRCAWGFFDPYTPATTGMMRQNNTAPVETPLRPNVHDAEPRR
jgi:hypothetical protein